ncbi:MAG: EAL domain-containing protein [Acidihalobacter sp.]
MPQPPSVTETDGRNGPEARLGEYLSFLDDLLDRAKTGSELSDTLIKGLIDLGVDAAWIGRLVGNELIEPEYWAGDRIERYLFNVEIRVDQTPEGSGPSGQAWRSGALQVVDDWLQHPAQMASWLRLGREYGWRASAAVPLLADGRTLALLNLYSQRPGFFAQSPWPFVLDRLRRAGGNALRRIGLTERLAEQQHYLAEVALRDPLTGLRNRVSLEDHIETAMARARRQEKLLAIGMLDLDSFKPINDTYGHAAGDAVIKAVAERLVHSLRETDGVFRYGGDEFVLLIENLNNLDYLDELLQRTGRELNAAILLSAEQRQVRIEASLGVVIYPFGAAEDNEPGALLRQADQALYRLKRNKARRKSWWTLYAQGHEEPHNGAVVPDTSDEVPPYGPRASALLESMTPAFDEDHSRPWMQALYQQILHRSDARHLLTILSQAETEHLLDALEQHAKMLCDPSLDALTHRRIALSSGHVHGVLGVEIGALMESYDLLIRILQRLAQAEGNHSHALNAVLTRRVGLDVRWQVHAYHNLAEQRQMALAHIDTLAWEADRYADLAQGVVDTLLELDEVISVTIGRPTSEEVFEFEFVGGPPFKQYLDSLSQDSAAPITIEANRNEGGGPTGRAWRGGRIERCLNYSTDPAMKPWLEVAEQIGIRSSVAIPLRSPQGEPRAILTLYCDLPGGYSSESQTHFLQHLQHTLGLALHSIESREGKSQAVPHASRRHWRQLIEEGLEMHYQPIIDLRDGRVMKVEALARLRGGETLLSPDQFLPTFTREDLRSLFEHGLDQAMGMRRQWFEQDCPLSVSVNLPTTALTDPSYVEITRGLLERHACPPSELFLEMLESDEPEDAGMRAQVLTQFRGLGVRLSEDDLGAGYSSLHRLSLLPFDIVKIDQFLVRGILNEPQRLLTFIRQLTRLGQDLGLQVAVEGLETLGLIEAAAILGADMGQGYAISHPLPASEVLDWARSYTNPLHPQHHPRTALGAMASFILWEEQLRSIAHQETLRPRFSAMPCRVGRYIHEQGLGGTALDHAHDHLHAVAQRENPLSSANYRQARDLFLNELCGLIA